MIHNIPSNQLSFAEFKTPFDVALDANNRWVTFSESIPWDDLANLYCQGFSHTGRRAKSPRLVIGAMILKHKLCLGDEETVRQIQENPYLQYFCGFPAYSTKQPFAPSLFVEIRKRMGEALFKGFEQAVIEAVDAVKKPSQPDQPNDDQSDPPPSDPIDEASTSPEQSRTDHQGKLILDATVAPQKIRFPTDISLLNEAREIAERILDKLYAQSDLHKKPRTYRQRARKDYLALVKQKRPRRAVRRKAIRKQLNYLNRNLKHIDSLWEAVCQPALPCIRAQYASQRCLLSNRELKLLWVIRTLYQQQQTLYDTKTTRVDDRIVSLHQPHVRPIVRGKPHISAEFGSKLSVSLTGEGIACLDAVRWDAFNEGQDLEQQVEHYRQRHGHYPEVVLADPVYGTRANRKYLKDKQIRFGGKPLGRPKKQTEANKDQLKAEKRQRKADYLQRIPIEGKFGQGKNGYQLNLIKAKTRETAECWIRSIFFVMNLIALWKMVREKAQEDKKIPLIFVLTIAVTAKAGRLFCWVSRTNFSKAPSPWSTTANPVRAESF